MITQSILNDTLKSFDYYKNKLPLYLQNSFGFIEHYRIWYNFLAGTNQYEGLIGNADIFLNLLLIFDSDYFTYLTAHLEDFSVTGTTCDILDKIGAIFGVTRHFEVTYISQSQVVQEYLTLNNNELLILIKGQIIKNYCEGTTAQMNEYYRTLGLKMYVQTATTPATAYLYLATIPGYQYSENIQKMFLGGMLKIESAGIKYIESFIDLSRLLIWDSDTQLWDGGQWVI